MTINEAKSLLNVSSDRALAKKLGLSRQAVSQWGGTVPVLREYQIKALARGE